MSPPAVLGRPSVTPSALTPAAIVVLAAVTSALGRPAALALPVLGGVAVMLAVRPRLDDHAQSLLAAVVGLVPAIVVLGAVHDTLGVVPPIPVSALLLLLSWWWAANGLGVDVARRIVGGARQFDVWARILAVGGATAFVSGALVRFLLPGATTADRLAWAIWEEDNAQIVGIGREVLMSGPRGAGLADQFGTAFVNLPLVLTRILGGTPAAETDPRLQAISLFTISTVVAIVMAGLAMMLLAALPHHVQLARREVAGGPVTILAGAAASSVAALIGLSVLVVLPMRTGFLTFVWGLMLVILGAALVAVTPSDVSPAGRVVLVVHLAAVLVLLLSSWPFIAPALLPLLLVPLVWIRWKGVVASVQRHTGRWSLAGLIALTAASAVVYWFSRWGPAAEVASYGLNILLVVASGIEADASATGAAFLAVLVTVALTGVLGARGSRLTPAIAIAGPVIGGGALYFALRAAAALLTDGELNYSGVKLFYGVVALAIVLGLMSLASQAARLGAVGALAALAVILAVHQTSATASLHTEWWERTAIGPQPHVEATIQTIRMTSPDLPIRCLPAPRTVVTTTSQWAAYTCVRWMEDAFNEDRFHGHRSDLLNARSETFAETVEEILATSPEAYLFAYRFTMGTGWFGWTGSGG